MKFVWEVEDIRSGMSIMVPGCPETEKMICYIDITRGEDRIKGHLLAEKEGYSDCFFEKSEHCVTFLNNSGYFPIISPDNLNGFDEY